MKCILRLQITLTGISIVVIEGKFCATFATYFMLELFYGWRSLSDSLTCTDWWCGMKIGATSDKTATEHELTG